MWKLVWGISKMSVRRRKIICMWHSAWMNLQQIICIISVLYLICYFLTVCRSVHCCLCVYNIKERWMHEDNLNECVIQCDSKLVCSHDFKNVRISLVRHYLDVSEQVSDCVFQVIHIHAHGNSMFLWVNVFQWMGCALVYVLSSPILSLVAPRGALAPKWQPPLSEATKGTPRVPSG